MTISVPEVTLVGEQSRDCTVRLDIAFNQEDAPGSWPYDRPAIETVEAQDGAAQFDLISEKICTRITGLGEMRDCWWPAWKIQSTTKAPAGKASKV